MVEWVLNDLKPRYLAYAAHQPPAVECPAECEQAVRAAFATAEKWTHEVTAKMFDQLVILEIDLFTEKFGQGSF